MRRAGKFVISAACLGIAAAGCTAAHSVVSGAGPNTGIPRSRGPSSAEYPDCTAAQLTGRAGIVTAGAGNVDHYLILTNSGTSPCSIATGPSSAVAIGADGTRLTLRTASMQGGYGDLTGPPVNLRPGQSAQAVTDSALGMADCTDVRSYTAAAIDIGVGDAGAVRISFPGGFTMNYCGHDVPYVLGFGVPASS